MQLFSVKLTTVVTGKNILNKLTASCSIFPNCSGKWALVNHSNHPVVRGYWHSGSGSEASIIRDSELYVISYFK